MASALKITADPAQLSIDEDDTYGSGVTYISEPPSGLYGQGEPMTGTLRALAYEFNGACVGVDLQPEHVRALRDWLSEWLNKQRTD